MLNHDTLVTAVHGHSGFVVNDTPPVPPSDPANTVVGDALKLQVAKFATKMSLYSVSICAIRPILPRLIASLGGYSGTLRLYTDAGVGGGVGCRSAEVIRLAVNPPQRITTKYFAETLSTQNAPALAAVVAPLLCRWRASAAGRHLWESSAH